MFQVKNKFHKWPLSPTTFYSSRHHHPLGDMGRPCGKVRTGFTCGSQAKGTGDPALRGYGQVFSRVDGGLCHGHCVL